MDATTLFAEAERLLAKHDPAVFDTTIDAWPECIEVVRAVEDEQAWRAGYPTLEAFYAAHEARHPDIRLYGRARREIAAATSLFGPGRAPLRAARAAQTNVAYVDRFVPDSTER